MAASSFFLSLSLSFGLDTMETSSGESWNEWFWALVLENAYEHTHTSFLETKFYFIRIIKENFFNLNLKKNKNKNYI